MPGFILPFISIVFFIKCISTSDKYIKGKDEKTFNQAQGSYKTAVVFFVLVGIGSVISVLAALLMFLSSAGDSTEDSTYIGIYMVFEFVICVIVLSLGIAALSKFHAAKKAHDTAVQSAPPNNGAKYSHNGKANNPTQPIYNSQTNYNTNSASFSIPAYTPPNGERSFNANETDDPTLLRSVTDDQTPFEAPPDINGGNPYGYGISGNYQSLPRQNVQYQAVPQNSASPKAFAKAQNTENTVSTSSVLSDTPAAKEYVSEMPTVSAEPPDIKNTVNTPKVSQAPAAMLISELSAIAEIKKEEPVRCVHCGVTNKAGDTICTFCGKNLRE